MVACEGAVLTRLEISGFKNLVELEVEFGPFTCIAGPNGSGKSNVFDAIQFLSLLSEHPIMQAAQLVRSTVGRSSDPKDLFFTQGAATRDELRFAAEMIVPQVVVDDFGRQAKVTSTFLRYEVHLGYESATSAFGSLGRLVLLHESLSHVTKSYASSRLPWASRAFRDGVIVNNRMGADFISTDISDDGTRTINVHQDAGSRGQPRPSPARSAPRTIVCTTNTASEPTVLAARREMQAWRTIALEPTAMRSPDDFSAPSQLASTGEHMAATLYRLATQHAEQRASVDDPSASMATVYASVAAKLSKLVDAREVRVDRDDKRELLTLELRLGAGGFFPARSLSDGTLRFLALSLLDADETTRGVITMEEPENGIHPERLPAMVNLLRGIAVDPSEPPGEGNPFRQLIVNTHSPGVVSLQRDEDLLMAKTVSLSSQGDEAVSVLRLRPLRKTWRAERDGSGVGRGELLAYLSAPRGAQLSLVECGSSRASDAD